MLARDEIISLYRCILGREPESEEAVEANMRMFDDFAQARSAFMESREFILASHNHDEGDVFYIPGRHRPFEKPADLIGLVSIVKNESDRISEMLASVLPLADFVGLVDTGSEDDTIDVAKNVLRQSGVPYAIERVEFRDFSQARNIALDILPPRIEWALALDADEHLVQEDYQRFVDLADISDVDAWNLPRFNFTDAFKRQPAAPYPDFQSRLFRHRSVEPIRYHGPVHEVLGNVRHWGVAPINKSGRHAPCGGPHIHHMGQVGLSAERWSVKHSFYERLLHGRSFDRFDDAASSNSKDILRAG